MRITMSATVLGILAVVACGQGGPTAPSGSCIGDPVVRVNGALFTGRGPGSATAADAGALVTVVTRERGGCNDVVIMVTDSAAPRRRSDPWEDGHASMLRVGTRVYERVGSEPGLELVAERAPGEWVRLVLHGVH